MKYDAFTLWQTLVDIKRDRPTLTWGIVEDDLLVVQMRISADDREMIDGLRALLG